MNSPPKRLRSALTNLHTTLMILSAVVAVGLGLGLRFNQLDKAPLHADEAATGAWILAERLESGNYTFDPKHYHGPLLTAAAIPIAKIRGEHDRDALTKLTLRTTTAVFGGLMVLAVCLISPRFRGYGLIAAAFVSTSPLLVYYSRVFIHESLQGFGAAVLIVSATAYALRPSAVRAAFAGVALGFMFANKETAAITLLAWLFAAAVLLFESQRVRTFATEHSGRLFRHAAIGAGVLLAVVAGAYTDLGRDPAGLLAFASTYFVYDTGDSHAKGLFYYLQLLVWPQKARGIWWGETLVFVLAVVGLVLSFRDRRGPVVRLIAYAAVVELLIYSLIAHKTPWLAVVFWLEVCCVAGYAVARMMSFDRAALRYAAVVVLLGVTGWQATHAYRAAHRFPVDDRNPYAYVSTSPDIEKLSLWLNELAAEYPEIEAGPLAVVGLEYWPLPWYLRDFDAVGYWPEVPELAATLPVVLVLPNFVTDTGTLDNTHFAVPRSLRIDTPLWVYIRRDIWDDYLNAPGTFPGNSPKRPGDSDAGFESGGGWEDVSGGGGSP